MSISVIYKKKLLLKCKNAIWGSIHENMRNIIEQDDIILSPELEKTMFESDQEIFGPGGITSRFLDNISSAKDMLIFADLLNLAYEKWIQDIPDLPVSYKLCIEQFHEHLLNIANELPNTP